MAPKSSDSSSKGDNKASDSSRLPFEPSKSRKAKESNKGSTKAVSSAQSTPAKQSGRSAASPQDGTVPKAVSDRMVRRMALFCGIPSFLGMATFFVSYFIVKNDVFPLPNAAVVLTSMGFFGLGVLGLSYGVLSASWEEDVPGSQLGWNEFTTNFSRMRSAWPSNKELLILKSCCRTLHNSLHSEQEVMAWQQITLDKLD